MELVPILSTIILVGTIATFILAVFAYILYKVRERKSRERAEQRPYREPMRQPSLGAPRQSGLALPHAQSQRMQSPMYIAPTTTLPPQGPVVEVDEFREASVPQQGWSQAPRIEQAVAAQPPSRPRQGDGGPGGAPRLTAPQYEPAGMGQRAEAPGSSLFWEYTDAGFVPVDPKHSPSREQQQRRPEPPAHAEEEEGGSAWL